MSKRVFAGKSETFKAGKLTKVDADGTSILVTRIDGELCAFRNQCSHLPLPLEGGKLEGNTITCPFHNSQFNVCTGENLDWVRGVAGVKLPGWSRNLLAMGQKPKGIAAYTIVEEDGEVYVEM